MKPKRLFALGFILLVLGIIWLLTMFECYELYAKIIPNTALMGILTTLSILMAVGGYIMIFAVFDT